MAWWDAFSNTGRGYEPESNLDVPEDYILIFGPKPAVAPGDSPNIYINAMARAWERRAENFAGIVEEFDFDKLLRDILTKSPLTGKKTKDRWLEISDPRNYDIHEPVLYEMNDGTKFIAFLDTPNNVPMNRVGLEAFKRSPSSKIIYHQVKTINAGIYVPNIHPGLRAPKTLAKNNELKPE